MRVAAQLTLAAFTLSRALTSPAATSLTMDQATDGSDDVVLRWESDASGPVTLLRREFAPDVAPGPLLPLHPIVDHWLDGLDGPSVTLPGEARLEVPDGANVVVRAYQILDASGGCSNVGWVLARRVAPRPPGRVGSQGDDLSLPPRGGVRDARALLRGVPDADRAEIWVPSECRLQWLERRPDRSFEGVNFDIPPDRSVRLVGVNDGIVLVGAADWTSRWLALDRPFGCSPVEDRVSLPWGSLLTDAFNLMCGLEDVYWHGDDGYPDICDGGVYDGTSTTVEQWIPTSSRITRLAFYRPGLPVPFFMNGSNADLAPSRGMVVLRRHSTGSHPLELFDMGAQAECRCADGDGDGEDDCTERLFGSDPNDAASHGLDRDGDGARDADDDCPSDADPAQLDRDVDGRGDACDPCPEDPANACVDPDGDRLEPGEDNCPDVDNADQADADQDRRGDACDSCPGTPDAGDDSDGDGVGDACDACPFSIVPDGDGDGWCDDVDDCPLVADAAQRDSDGDGFGDACECVAWGRRLPEVRGLRVERPIPYMPFVRRLSWLDDRQPPLSATRFNVLSGALDELSRPHGYRSVECLAVGLRRAELYEGFDEGARWYLVAASNSCELLDWGQSSTFTNYRAALEHGPCP